MNYKLTFNQLLSCNVHIGHSLKSTLLFSSWILYGKRQGLWIIDLKITLIMFKSTFRIIKFIINSYNPFWFINLDKAMKQLIEQIAYQCGEFAIVGFWIRGLITNFINVKDKLFLKKEFFLRYSWPRCVFISSAFFSGIAVKESTKAKIPNISIIDTNVKSYGINLAIPGNDDNLDCILFYNYFYANLILKEKFFQIILWYRKIYVKKKIFFLNYDFFYFNNDLSFIENDYIYLYNAVKYYCSSFVMVDFQKRIYKISSSFDFFVKRFNKFLNFFKNLKIYYLNQKTLTIKNLIFSKRRIKFYLKRYKRFNFKRILYKNIHKNTKYFNLLKYLVFLCIFLYKITKRKILTCNRKISLNFFSFFLKKKLKKFNEKKIKIFKMIKKKRIILKKNYSFKYYNFLMLWLYIKKYDKRYNYLKLRKLLVWFKNNKNIYNNIFNLLQYMYFKKHYFWQYVYFKKLYNIKFNSKILCLI